MKKILKHRYQIGLVFLILCINKLGFVLIGGEEQYLSFSKQFINPLWIPDSFTLEEFAGTRILFQAVFGYLLYYLDFEWVTFLGRIVIFFCASIPLSLLYKKLNFKWYEILLTLQLFVMSDQSFFGGEWMLGGVEPKSIAYIFVFYGIYSFLEKDFKRISIYMVVATYFHFLIGGWFFICFLIYIILSRYKEVFKFGLIYSLGIAPLFVYLLYGYFLTKSDEIAYDLNWVYCYYRLPHHLGLFTDYNYFFSTHFGGILISILILAGLATYRKFIDERFKGLITLMMIILTVNLLFVAVAWLDKFVFEYQLSGLLKFYPFRTNSMAMFLSVLMAIYYLFVLIKKSKYSKVIFIVLMANFIALSIAQGVNNIQRQRKPFTADYLEMCEFIKENTQNTDKFILTNIGINDRSYYAFTRKSERDNFSVFKFVPGEKQKLNEWYRRQNQLIDVNRDISKIENLKKEYSIQFMLSAKPVSDFELVKNIGGYFLYKID